MFGPYTITDHDRREVLGYRLALTAVALGQLGLLLSWRQGGNALLWPWLLLMAAGLGLALRWIHIYLRPLHQALQLREQAGESWLCGPGPTLADVVLFPTLIRLEMVYAPLFGCSRLPLAQLPALWRWQAHSYGLEGVRDTCCPEAWRTDYFGALFPLHPSGIIPAGPDLATLVAGIAPPASTP